MPVLGFNYTELSAEKMAPVQGKVSINNNVSVTSVDEQEISFDDQEAVRIEFRYQSEYEPEVANITIEGNIIYVSEQYSTDELVDEWGDSESLPEDAMRDVINNVLSKCNVEAILLSRDLNIPSPIPLPKVEDADE